MKKLYIFLFLSFVVIGLAASIVTHIRHSNMESFSQQKAQWDEEKLELQAELDSIHAKTEGLRTLVKEQDSPELEPQTLIEGFQKMKDWSDIFADKSPSDETSKAQCHDQLEEALFIFQGLQIQGNKSIKNIYDYLTNGHNVTLYSYNKRVPTSRPSYLYRLKKTDIKKDTIPETSRLGMIYTLDDINTPDSRAILYQAMLSFTNLKEIISSGNILLASDKEAFSQPVLNIYKTVFPTFKREEQNTLLACIKDISKEDCKELLNISVYDENGKLSIDKLCLKMENLGEEAIPDAYEAFNRADATLKEKINILDSVRKFIGSNEQANSIFLNLINGLEDDYKGCVASQIIKNITENIEGKEKQQQFLNLLNQLSLQENDQTFFTESLTLMKGMLAQKIEQGESFDQKEYERKNFSDFYKQYGYSEGRIFFRHPDDNDIVYMVREMPGTW
ncbi:MAG: hypothetical protein IJU47_00825 [Verrucomicrobia bacterium]|nr:hypothetical protein [Verrucomicrobiota bacterium]